MRRLAMIFSLALALLWALGAAFAEKPEYIFDLELDARGAETGEAAAESSAEEPRRQGRRLRICPRGIWRRFCAA